MQVTITHSGSANIINIPDGEALVVQVNAIGDVTAEATARAAADATLQANIDAEASARTSADSTLQSNITAEATTRATADTALQSAIDAEASARTSADSTLQSNITAEATTRATADNPLLTPTLFTDFTNNNGSVNTPYIGNVISSGTTSLNNTNYNSNTFGILRITSSTTANSGVRWNTNTGTGNSAFIATGGEVFRTSIAMCSFNNNTVRAGFLDNSTSTDANNGMYFEITSSAIAFKTAKAGTRTTVSNMLTLTANTFYKLEIIVNNANSVTANIYNVSGATLLATTTVTTNIPNTTANACGIQVIATNSSTTATDICDIDYIYFSKSMIR